MFCRTSRAVVINGCVPLRQALDQKVLKHSPSLGREAEYTMRSRLSRLPTYLTVHMVRFTWRRDIDKKAKIMVSRPIISTPVPSFGLFGYPSMLIFPDSEESSSPLNTMLLTLPRTPSKRSCVQLPAVSSRSKKSAVSARRFVNGPRRRARRLPPPPRIHRLVLERVEMRRLLEGPNLWRA